MASPLELDAATRPAPGAGSISVSERELDRDTDEIAVEGELDLSTAPRLKWALLDSIERGHMRFLLDLSRVTFIDSTALSVLVAANRRLSEGARMAVVCTSPSVLRIFAIAGLEEAFAIFPTREDALAALRADAD
jgi:anti-sigma B factor antagonist